MPLDGITIASLVHTCKPLIEGRVDKIAQPESDEIVLSIRARGQNHKVLMTANASHPRLHFTAQQKSSPAQAPMFCMVLRKHLGGGKILAVLQPDFERIVEWHIESYSEMGDLSTKRLIIEMMGKHSNIILCNESGVILDAIKHVSFDTSSVREVLPGKIYSRPPSQQKISPLRPNADYFFHLLDEKPHIKMQHLLYQSYNGISPIMASEICERAGIAPDVCAETCSAADRAQLYRVFAAIFTSLTDAPVFQYRIYRDEKDKPFEFSALALTLYRAFRQETFASPSEMLEAYYQQKDQVYRIAQKTADLRKLITGHIERCLKKRDMYEKILANIQNRDQYRLYGELLTAYVYAIEKGAESYTAKNFYDDTDITISLDPTLTPAENAQAYFKRYNKEKRTYAALQQQIKQNDEELAYLESVSSCLQAVTEESEIAEIRAELSEQGFVKRKYAAKAAKIQKKSKPLHYISSDGFDIYVGKNNTQNDELTLRFAQHSDIWMHTKEIAGSHVIIKTNGATPPDRTLNEAANLAAYFSKGRGATHVPVDYTLKKFVKKPNGAKPGFVIYETNKTAYITPQEPALAPQ